MKIHSIKGMRDIGPAEIEIWQAIESIAREVFETANFSELRTPVLEEEALFTQSIGNSTEIVEKEMYRFPDRHEKMLALRPEGTASVVRAYIENYLSKGEQSHRFYYIGPMFRYERPQKGRYRQFYQIGAEVFGLNSPFADAELIHLVDEIFRKLGLQNVQLQINSLGCKKCRPIFREALLQFLQPLAPKLCEDCNRRLTKNPLRILDCKNEKCKEAIADAPSSIQYLDEECLTHFESVQKWLRAFSVQYQVNPRIVRGLDYYERTAFEFLSNDLGSQNAVAGGGRYDDLVHSLGGPPTPAVGFALGLERLVSLVSENSSLKKKRRKIYFACLGEAAQMRVLPFLLPLRQAGNVVYIDSEGKSLKSMLRYADRWGANYAVILGENELNQGIVQLKEMKEQGEQKEIPIDSLIAYFQNR